MATNFDVTPMVTRAVMSGFFPENGNTATLSPLEFSMVNGNVHGFTDLDIQASITPAGIKSVCTDYSVGAGKSLQPNLAGSYPASDGTRYVVGNDNISSQIYQRGKPDSKGVCSLTSVASLPNTPLLQAWKQADGSFLAQNLLDVSGMDGISSELVVIRNGVVESRLVSTNSANSPAVPATACCGFKVDWSRNQFLVTHMANGGHAFVYKGGVMNPFYGNEDGYFSNYIYALDLSDQWAVLGGGSSSGFKMLLVNTKSGEKYPLSKTGDTLPGGIVVKTLGDGAVAITPDGIVFFVGYSADGNSIKLYRATVPGTSRPTIVNFTADPSASIQGDPVELTWVTNDATSAAIDQGIGTVALSGSVTVTPTVTTPYTLTATGSGGTTSSTVTVTVTPRTLVPTISDGGVVNAASFDPKLSPGMYASVFGKNLSDGTAIASLPYPVSWLVFR